MKKSKKVILLKHFGHCVSCKYSHFDLIDDYRYDEIGFCKRHNDPYCYSFDSACPHYVPFNDVMPPHKFSFYWLVDFDDVLPF